MDIYVDNAVKKGVKTALTDFPIHTIFEIRFLNFYSWGVSKLSMFYLHFIEH
jgi:hypothetical protein